jgi:hypothetical protein
MHSVKAPTRAEYIKIVIQSEHFPKGMLPINTRMKSHLESSN